MLSSALAFASIVQLLAIHKQETKSSDIGEFRAWLGAHNFPELRTLLEDNRESTRRVKEYLGDTDGRFTGKLDEIRGVVDGLVAVLTGADASAVEASGLSAQAINILEQMVQVDAEEIGLIKSMRHVELEVFDGPGIPEEYHEKIFEKFIQVQNGKERVKRGTGLGLPIVKYIIKHLGGRVWVESEEGKGAKFLFALPI